MPTIPAEYFPFIFALGLLFGLVVLEVLAQVMGGSLLGDSGDASLPDELDALGELFDLDPGGDVDVDALVDASESMEASAQSASPGSGGSVLSMLGIGQVPMLIWVGAFLSAFGLFGIGSQLLAESVLGSPLPRWIAVSIAAVLGLLVTRKLAGWLARLVPQHESSALSQHHLAGLRGVVSQGVARHDSAAEVQVRDWHGNTHYVRCESFQEGEELPQGTPVLLVRERLGKGQWRLRALGFVDPGKRGAPTR